MRGSVIGHMAAARTVPRIAAGSGKRLVQIWDVDAAKLICEIDTVLDIGGLRLALSPNGELCVAASWRKGKRAGIAGYNANTGAEVWHRSDITHTQTLYFSTLDDRIWCEIQDAPALCLDPSTGTTLETLRGIVKVRDGGSRRQQLREQRNQKGFLLLTGQSRQLIPPMSFAMLDAAFSPETFCLSESTKPARMFDCALGAEIWRYGRDLWHFVSIWYQPANDLFYAVELGYRGAGQRIVRFPARGGEPEEVWNGGFRASAMCTSANLIVTSNGEVIDAATGAIKCHLEFPTVEIPPRPPRQEPL